MGKKTTLVALAIVFFGIVGAMFYLLTNPDVIVLHPSGIIGQKERTLIIFTFVLTLVVVVPVYAMLFFFAWKYHVDNTHKKYSPNWDHSVFFETVWWGVPLLIIIILGAVTYTSSRALNPSKAIEAAVPPLTIQVVALQWKWLFIYPSQHIASVNYFQFPVNTPINFEITSDAPMNSFWIPSLGSQIYAMSGMTTHLHLMTSRVGKYYGSSANISGKGFAGMNFIAEATDLEHYDSYIWGLQNTTKTLDTGTYTTLAKPSDNFPVTFYGETASGLYSSVLLKYMPPGTSLPSMNIMGGM